MGPNRQIHSDREQMNGCQGTGFEGDGMWPLMGLRFPWGSGNVWKLGSGGVHSILQIYPKPPNSTVQTSEAYGMGVIFQ